MGYLGICGDSFAAVLVINRVSIKIPNLTILVINSWWVFFTLAFTLGLFLSHFLIIIEEKIDKSPSQSMLTVFNIGLN